MLSWWAPWRQNLTFQPFPSVTRPAVTRVPRGRERTLGMRWRCRRRIWYRRQQWYRGSRVDWCLKTTLWKLFWCIVVEQCLNPSHLLIAYNFQMTHFHHFLLSGIYLNKNRIYKHIGVKGNCKPHTCIFFLKNRGKSTNTVTNEHKNRSPQHKTTLEAKTHVLPSLVIWSISLVHWATCQPQQWHLVEWFTDGSYKGWWLRCQAFLCLQDNWIDAV